jgi:alkylhydroperoxidase family enzyme
LKPRQSYDRVTFSSFFFSQKTSSGRILNRTLAVFMRITIDSNRVAKTFEKFSDNRSLQESAQLFARGLPIAEMIQAFAMNENVLRAFAGFECIYPGGTLERSVLEKVILRVSQLHDCQFCIHSHLDIMGNLGIATELSPVAQPTERECLAVEYAELVTRDSNRVPDVFFEHLSSVFSDSEIVELTFHTGFITMLNRFNNALQVRYNGEFNKVEVR